MFILKSKHEAELALRDKKHEANLQRALDAERSITASLRKEVAELRPLADRMNAKLERDRNYSRKRKAKA